MHPLFEPWLVNEPFGDPGLYVDFCDERRGLLFDLGNIAGLLPRHLMRLSHAFVTHAHMDHFCGFDHLLRVVLGRKAGLVLYGGPDFVAQVEHKLRAYTWNVAHRYEVELVLDVREIGSDGGVQRACFSSRRRFAREACAGWALAGDVVHDEASFRVRGRFVDHDIPCLAYAIEEKARLRVAKDRLPQLGLATGAWLRDLKHAVLNGAPDETPIRLAWRDRLGDHADSRPVGELRHLILDVVPGRRLGYVTDLRYTERNVATLAELFQNVDLLFIESVFLHRDKAHGLRKNHLTAHQAGLIARRIGARAVVPFHFSPRYQGRSAALVAEVQAAWSGEPAPPAEEA
jgi:ribonuclease Z